MLVLLVVAMHVLHVGQAVLEHVKAVKVIVLEIVREDVKAIVHILVRVSAVVVVTADAVVDAVGVQIIPDGSLKCLEYVGRKKATTILEIRNI